MPKMNPTSSRYFSRALVLGGAALLLFPLSVQAKPAAEASFSPAKTWHVHAEMTDIAGAAVQNCSVSTEFNNGFIVQLDGSHKGLQTISLNLRQDALIKGEAYPITLAAGNHAQVSLRGVASAKNVVTANISGQNALYDALRDNGVLDVNIEGNEFRFYMTNFAAAAGGFERCMAGGEIRAAENNVSKSAKSITLQASKSEDPFTGFTTNEAIALEEQETRATQTAAQEPETTRPMPQRIPYEEAHYPVAGKSLYIPPRDGSDLSTIARVHEPVFTPSPEPASDEAVIADLALGEADVPMPDPAKLSTPISTAEDLNRQQLAQIEGRVAPPVPTPAQTDMSVEEPMEAPAADIPVSEPAPTEAVPVTPPTKTRFTSPEVKITRNTAPRIEADFTHIEPASNDGPMPFGRDPDIGRKISQLEKMINGLEQENAALKDELDTTLSETKQEQVTISSDNWNLERATMRYTEAERQLKTLGGQLQRERIQGQKEKKELEAMLFDPSITDQAQMERLVELERKLHDAEEKLKAQEL